MKIKQLLLSIFFSVFVVNFSSANEVFETILLEGNSNLTMKPKQQATLQIKYEQRHGNHRMPLTHFMPMHEKLMHMIVVREDLEEFSHIHPTWNSKKNTFEIALNSTSLDPDNQDLSRAISSTGNYYFFTESMPMNHDGGEMQMLYSRFQVSAQDSTVKTNTALTKTSPSWDEIQEVYLQKNGSRGVKGDPYLVKFSVEQFDFCDLWMPKFYIEFYELKNQNYSRVQTGFEKWLGMGGHAVLLSNQKKILSEKIFQHLHAFLPISTPGEFTFPYDDHKNQLPNGEYKIWFQVKFLDKIRTIPFQFHYKKPDSTPQNLCF